MSFRGLLLLSCYNRNGKESARSQYSISRSISRSISLYTIEYQSAVCISIYSIYQYLSVSSVSIHSIYSISLRIRFIIRYSISIR